MAEQRAERVATLISNAVSELRKHVPSYGSNLGLAQRFFFENLENRITGLVNRSEIAAFLLSQPFSEFVDLAIVDLELRSAILGQDLDLSRPDAKLLFRMVIEMYLLRGLLAVHYHSREVSAQIILEFTDFLRPGEVERKVMVPLKHLALEQDRYDLGDFGTLQISGPTQSGPETERLGDPLNCFLNFSVKTKKYFGVFNYPLAEEIRDRVAALRMAVSPFISFNHFSVSHVHPWEDPLQDSQFYERFHGIGMGLGMRKGISVLGGLKASSVSLEEAGKLFAACNHQKWKQLSSWRLALNRLDDATFKIESGSQDALLDVVIGLESVLVEAESAQESTHKVAVRAARLLGDEPRARQDMFKSVKKLYALRSKIAHGKSPGFDAAAEELLSQGIRILARILRKMVEADRVALDLSSLDLS